MSTPWVTPSSVTSTVFEWPPKCEPASKSVTWASWASDHATDSPEIPEPITATRRVMVAGARGTGGGSGGGHDGATCAEY